MSEVGCPRRDPIDDLSWTFCLDPAAAVSEPGTPIALPTIINRP